MNKLQTLKGFRDFLPAEATKRQYAISILKSVFELYGFDPLETPALEYEEILLGKYGEEGDKLMYRFEDNGKRRVALRYDQTVPLARVINQYQTQLSFPFKRYQIQPVWRAENTQRGRFREFLQCDVDIVGAKSESADAEIIAVVNTCFLNLGFENFKILINDRAIFGRLPVKAITIIDKLKKIGDTKVKAELRQNGFDEKVLDKIKYASPTEDLETIKEISVNMGVSSAKINFEPTLARGLDYYTGTIIEVEIEGYSVGSVGGGGRYDNLLGLFGKIKIPAVGFAFGFDRIIDAMSEQNKFPREFNTTSVLITVFKPELTNVSVEICSLLRSNNINSDLWLEKGTKIDKQLKYADQKKTPFAIIIGPNEAKAGTLVLKNLKTREQKILKKNELVATLKANLAK